MNDSQHSQISTSSRKQLAWTLAALLALLLVGVGCGRGGHHGHDFVQWRIERMLDRVDATDEQQEQIEAIVERRMAALHEMRGEPGAVREQAVALLSAEQIDRDAIEAMRAEQMQRMAVASREVTDGLAEIADILTHEQRVELAEMAESHHHHFRHRRGFWHH